MYLFFLATNSERPFLTQSRYARSNPFIQQYSRSFSPQQTLIIPTNNNNLTNNNELISTNNLTLKRQKYYDGRLKFLLIFSN